MRTHTIQGTRVKRVGELTILDDTCEYVVVGEPKDHDGGPRIAHRGSYDACADYAERNDSPDNYEWYYVAEVVPTLAVDDDKVKLVAC